MFRLLRLSKEPMTLRIFLIICLQDKSTNTIAANFFIFGDKDPAREFDDKSKNNKFSRLHTFNGDSF